MHIQNKVSLQNIIMHNHTNIADNYYLAGYYTGDYMLQSKWQHENGPRMFYPMFGFAYKAVNTNVKVSLIKDGDSNHVIVLDRFVEKVNAFEMKIIYQSNLQKLIYHMVNNYLVPRCIVLRNLP